MKNIHVAVEKARTIPFENISKSIIETNRKLDQHINVMDVDIVTVMFVFKAQSFIVRPEM